MKLCLLILTSILLGCAPDAITRHASADSASAIAQAKAAEESLERITRLGLRWRYLASTDDMTSGTIRNAVVNSLNEVQFGFPYQGAQRAQLELRTHPRWGKDVILSISRGQFLCHSDECSVLIRYDDGKAWEYPAREPANNTSTELFIQGYADIVHSLKAAKRVRIEARFWQQSPPPFEFDVSNLEWPRQH